DQVEQGGLAAARRAGDGEELPLAHVQADPSQRLHHGGAERLVLGGVLHGDDGLALALHFLGSSGREASSRLTSASTACSRRRNTGARGASTRADSAVGDPPPRWAKVLPASVMAMRLARRSSGSSFRSTMPACTRRSTRWLVAAGDRRRAVAILVD